MYRKGVADITKTLLPRSECINVIKVAKVTAENKSLLKEIYIYYLLMPEFS